MPTLPTGMNIYGYKHKLNKGHFFVIEFVSAAQNLIIHILNKIMIKKSPLEEGATNKTWELSHPTSQSGLNGLKSIYWSAVFGVDLGTSAGILFRHPMSDNRFLKDTNFPIFLRKICI